MSKGSLIILNGGSSAGKTSLGRALQETMLPETWLLDGIKRSLQGGLAPTAFAEMRRRYLAP